VPLPAQHGARQQLADAEGSSQGIALISGTPIQPRGMTLQSEATLEDFRHERVRRAKGKMARFKDA